MELFHGRTQAFKDMALSLFPYLLVAAKEAEGETKEVLILTATSGDTGKAALEGFKDVPGTHIQVFYPTDGVSPMQAEQMQKQEGANVNVTAIHGNFDDAQQFLKRLFVDANTAKEVAEKGKQSAAMYGCRGWTLHHNTDIWRSTGSVDGPGYGIWPTCNSWFCQHLWDHYLFSGK